MKLHSLVATVFLLPAMLPICGAAFPADPDNLCFMRTSSGQTLNLGTLCGETPGGTPVTPPVQNQNKFSVSELSYDGDWVIGRVKNGTKIKAKFVEIVYEVLDADGKLVDTGSTFSEPSTLAPGQSGTFKGPIFKAGNKVRITNVKWLQSG